LRGKASPLFLTTINQFLTKSNSARANRKWCELAGCLVARSYVLQADKQPEVIISGLLFFGSFLLEEQKK
jgi:hypothetical protein